MFFEYQTIRELTEYFIIHYSPQLAALFATSANRISEATPVAAQAPPSAPTRLISSRRFRRVRGAALSPPVECEAIAIIGLSGRYPEAVNIDAYWQNLREGKACIIEGPKERWDWQAYFNQDPPTSYHPYTNPRGFIPASHTFYPPFFTSCP